MGTPHRVQYPADHAATDDGVTPRSSYRPGSGCDVVTRHVTELALSTVQHKRRLQTVC